MALRQVRYTLWFSLLIDVHLTVSSDISSQKTVREGAVDSVRGVEAAIELYKDPEYGIV